MLAWLRSIVDAISGKVPGKTGRLDVATRMAADFSHRRESVPLVLPRSRERDEGQLVKLDGPLADNELFEELIRIAKQAQKRDAADESRLYDPMVPDRLSFQRRPDLR